MNKTVFLVTGNKGKVEVARHALAKYQIGVEQIDIDTPEIQAASTDDVALYSVKYAAEKVGKPVMKGDFGMHIEALRGFLGPFVKFINSWFTADQFVRLYAREDNKRAYFTDALGYCEPGKEPVCFVTKTHGTLIAAPQGDNGNMVDSLFIPDGYHKTIAQLSKDESLQLWSNDRYQEISLYLRSK